MIFKECKSIINIKNQNNLFYIIFFHQVLFIFNLIALHHVILHRVSKEAARVIPPQRQFLIGLYKQTTLLAYRTETARCGVRFEFLESEIRSVDRSDLITHQNLSQGKCKLLL